MTTDVDVPYVLKCPSMTTDVDVCSDTMLGFRDVFVGRRSCSYTVCMRSCSYSVYEVVFIHTLVFEVLFIHSVFELLFIHTGV